MGRHTKPSAVLDEARRVFDLKRFLDEQGINEREELDIAVESETDFKEFVTSLVKADGEESSEIAARETYIKELKDGLDRKKKRRDARRQLLCAALLEAGEQSFSTPAGTVSLNPGRESVEIIDEMKIHKSFWKPQPDKIDIETISGHLKARAKALAQAYAITDDDEREEALAKVEEQFPDVSGASLVVGEPFVRIKRS